MASAAAPPPRRRGRDARRPRAGRRRAAAAGPRPAVRRTPRPSARRPPRPRGPARMEPEPDDNAAGRERLDPRPGQRAGELRHRTQPAQQLDAAVRDVAVDVRCRTGRDALHPGRRHEPGQRRGGWSLHVARTRRRRVRGRSGGAHVPILGLCEPGMVEAAVSAHSDEFHRMVDALAEVERADSTHWTSFSVRGRRFGYYWPRTHTAGLKQTLSGQLALVADVKIREQTTSLHADEATRNLPCPQVRRPLAIWPSTVTFPRRHRTPTGRM